MLTLRLGWRLARGQQARIWLLIACIALGVCARVCVGSFSGALDRALAREARPLLGADVEIASNQPLTTEQEADITQVLPTTVRVSHQVRFTTMALAEDSGRARTVEVRAIDPDHPLYGTVDVAPGRLDTLFGSDPVTFVQQELLDQLAVAVGSRLRLGAEGFRIAGIIREEPGLGANPFTLGPRVLIARARLADTGLDGGGARLRFARLLALPEDAVDGVVTSLRERWKVPEKSSTGFGGRVENDRGVSVRTAAQASASAARIYERVGDFLRIIALAALLLGGIGVASLVRGFLADSRDTVAVLQVLGATPGRVMAVFLWQSALVGLAGGVLGALAGGVLQNVLLVLGRKVLPVSAELGLDYPALGWGVVLGVGVSVGFAALVLVGVHGMRPAALLRDDAPASSGRWRSVLMAILLFAIVLVVAAQEAHSWRTGPLIVVALVVGGGLTALVGWAVLGVPQWIARLVLRGRWFGIRHGLGNLTRPGFRPLAAVVAIAMAAQLLEAMATYRVSLSADLASGGEGNRPGWFCLGLEADQVEPFTTLVHDTCGVEPLLSPMVIARLKTINGKEPQRGNSATREGERGQFMRGREQRISFRKTPGPDERIVAGEWMRSEGDRVEASLEQRFAGDIGAHLGDVLTFDVQGVPLEATVTSIRSVRWVNLRPNFFILVSAHALMDAPQAWIAAIPRATDGRGKDLVATLAQRFPNVTTFDIGELGEKLGVVVERIGLAVRFLGWFCLGAGILVLIGIGIGTGRQRRGDAALVAVLGGTRRTLVASIVAEFATLGVIAAACGLAFGVLHARLVLSSLLELHVVVPWLELVLVAAAIVVIGALSGLAACRGVFSRHPLAVLRDD
ncbi:MAG TPA: FtsX-like permease family protein [Planctomycetota bacterium]|nr:FtsX-like permease family protein [Planctomycetota bacterium]